MWDETKQQQLNDLRGREVVLSDEERLQLEQLLYELEQEEWERLNPALEHARAEQSELQQKLGQTNTQNAVLSAIAARQEDLLKRAKVQLTAMRSEHEILRAEREHVLTELAR